MAQSNSTASNEAAKNEAASHSPAASLKPASESAAATGAHAAQPSGATFVQRTSQAIENGSPQANPSRYGSLLGQLHGASSAQQGVLRQLQRSYGNLYVGQVIQRAARNKSKTGAPQSAQREAASADALSDINLSEQIRAASSGGQQLDVSAARQLEGGLGADLSDVRVHTDERADELARSVNARAFTTGRDIFFRAGAYDPASHDGMRLLAHEAAHTVQQASGTVAGTPATGGIHLSDPADSFEREAEEASEKVSTGESYHVGSAAHAQQDVNGDASRRVEAHPNATANAVQRFAGAGGAAPTGETKTETKETDKAVDSIPYGDHVLTTNTEDMFQVVSAEAKKGGVKAAKAFAEDFISTWPHIVTNEVYQANVTLANDIYFVLLAQIDRLRTYKSILVGAFAEQALLYGQGMLDASEEIINKEIEHYGIHKNEAHDPTDPDPRERYTGDTGFKKEMTNADATQGLIDASKELLAQKNKVKTLLGAVGAMQEMTHTAHAKSEDPEDAKIRAAKQEELYEADFKYSMMRAGYEAEYPILTAFTPLEVSGGLEEIAAGQASTESTVVPLIAQRLANIETVRGGMDKLIWKHDSIMKGTKAQMGIPEDSVDSKLLDEHAGDLSIDEMLLNLGIGVFTIALGLVAALPTGGASLGVAIAATAAATGGLTISAIQAIKAVQQYELELAAGGTHFDKAKAISQEDPSLFWLALDIVAVGFDIYGAVAAFRSLSQAVRAAIAARALVKEGEAAAKAAGMAKELEAIKALTAKHPGLYERILKRIGEAADAGKVPLAELESSARAQYKALKESNRLGEIGDISEELFVQQMVSGARGQIVISGAAGVKRTKIVTSLMEPGSPIIRAILADNNKAMDALLIQHGNWKQLVSMLEQGTPDMRAASKRLLARRAQIEAEVNSKYGAELVGKPSAEAVSDVDRSTMGLEAGKKMIDAENWVRQQYGEGWSEALRMNFYTEAARMSQYESVKHGLSAGQRATILKEFSKQAEVYNVAKSWKHAQGNPELEAAVKRYAETIGVKIEDPEVQRLLGLMHSGMTLQTRNKLLLEIDDLVQQLHTVEKGSPEYLRLARKITSKQMEANVFTMEANIGPGAARLLASNAKIVGHEAYQAGLSFKEMIFHTIASNAGDIELTMRQYEIYKYMNRFASVAEMAGVKHPAMQMWKTFSGSIYRTERQALEEVSHLRPWSPASVADPDMTGVEARRLYESWQNFSEKVLGDMKRLADENPSAWTP